MFFAYAIPYRRAVIVADKGTKRARSMLLLLPQEVVQRVPSIASFVGRMTKEMHVTVMELQRDRAAREGSTLELMTGGGGGSSTAGGGSTTA